MGNMFNVQLPMIPSRPGSTITANSGLSFKDALELLMVAIYISLHHLLSKVSIVIAKAFFHRTASSYAISTCTSHTFLPAGKALRRMLGSGMMHYQEGFQCPKDSITLQMEGILIARNFLSLFVECGITFRSGGLQVFGMCLI
jgi:hypothetical protein